MVDQLHIKADLGERRSAGRGRLSLGVAVTGIAMVARFRLGGGDAGESGMVVVAQEKERESSGKEMERRKRGSLHVGPICK